MIPSHLSICASDLGRRCSAWEVKGWLHDAVMEWSFVAMQLFQGITSLLELTFHPGCQHASSPSWCLVNSYVWCRIWCEHTFGFITPGKVNAIVSGWQGSLSLWESDWGAEGQGLQVPWQIMVSRWYSHLLVMSLGLRARKLGICWEKSISMICRGLSLVSELQEGADQGQCRKTVPVEFISSCPSGPGMVTEGCNSR